MKAVFLPAFALVAALDLYAVAVGNREMALWAKPLLMPLLGAWFWLGHPAAERTRPHQAVLLALIFSTLGDIALMFPGNMAFMLGLGSFLLTHLCYIAAFTHLKTFRAGFVCQRPLALAPFLLYALCLLAYLWEGIPSPMRAPVSVYALVISAMALSVANLYQPGRQRPFWAMLAGASLFVLSDSLIAISKFSAPFPGIATAIMATYLLGQFLLVAGASRMLR